MDVIDNELKRYDSMQTELESLKQSVDNLNTVEKSTPTASRDQSKSFDDLDTLMNEEKPKEVSNQIHRLFRDFDGR